MNGSDNGRLARATGVPDPVPDAGLHAAWLAFVQFCEDLRHGEIERLKIQDGLPILAEVTKKKIKFSQ